MNNLFFNRVVRWAPTLFFLLGANAFAQSSTQAVTINYGVVTSVGTVQKDAKHAGGALAGGMMGALIGPRRHRGLRIAAGAAAGAAIQGAATSGTLQQYTVDLIGGGTSVVSTEQTDIRIDDCVAVEQGQYANIRRVSGVHCARYGTRHAAPASPADFGVL